MQTASASILIMDLEYFDVQNKLKLFFFRLLSIFISLYAKHRDTGKTKIMITWWKKRHLSHIVSARIATKMCVCLSMVRFNWEFWFRCSFSNGFLLYADKLNVINSSKLFIRPDRCDIFAQISYWNKQKVLLLLRMI